MSSYAGQMPGEVSAGGGGGGGGGLIRPGNLSLTTLAGAPNYDGDGILTMVAGDVVGGEAKEHLTGFNVVGDSTVDPSGANLGLVGGLDRGDGTNANTVGIALLSAPRAGTLDGLWSASPLSSIWTIQSSSFSGTLTPGAFEAQFTFMADEADSSPRVILSARRSGFKFTSSFRDIAPPAGWGITPAAWGSKRILLAVTSGTWKVYWLAETFGGGSVDLSAL